MMCIHRKMNLKWRLISKSSFITPKHIWAKLRSMYDLEALDESECCPFPEKTEDFLLPNEDFGPLMTGLPTNSNDTSRSSTVDREVEEECKTADSALKEESPVEETPVDAPAAATPPSSSADAVTSINVEMTISASTATTTAPATPLPPPLPLPRQLRVRPWVRQQLLLPLQSQG